MGDINKDDLKNIMKEEYIEYIWNIYKLNIDNVFDNNSDDFFKFIESINLKEEISKIATREYLDILERYSKFKKDNNID